MTSSVASKCALIADRTTLLFPFGEGPRVGFWRCAKAPTPLAQGEGTFQKD